MLLDELMELPLKEVLEEYCLVYNEECGYYYGIFKREDVEKLHTEFNIENDYPQAFSVECLINEEVLVSFDKIKGYDILLTIMKNLGISRKKLKQK